MYLDHFVGTFFDKIINFFDVVVTWYFGQSGDFAPLPCTVYLVNPSQLEGFSFRVNVLRFHISYVARFFFKEGCESQFKNRMLLRQKIWERAGWIYWRQKSTVSEHSFTSEKQLRVAEQGSGFPTSKKSRGESHSNRFRTVGTRESQFKNPKGYLTQIGSERSGLAKAGLKILGRISQIGSELSGLAKASLKSCWISHSNRSGLAKAS